MNKTKTILIYTLMFVILLFIQIYIIDIKNLFGVKPDILLIMVIVSSLWNNLKFSSICSLLIGIYLDILYRNEFGIYTLGFVLVSTIIGYINTNYKRDSKMTLIYITFLGTTIFEIYKYITYMIISNTAIGVMFLVKQIIISAILNMIISFILYNVFVKIHKSIYNDDEYVLNKIK